MLQEQDREKLDGIVKQMISNKESDANIQLVVNDFISKYSKPTSRISEVQSRTQKPVNLNMGDVVNKTGGFYKDTAIGGVKGALSTVSGASKMGQGMLDTLIGNPVRGLLGVKEKPKAVELPKTWTEPTNAVQGGAKMGEQVAEFMIPAGSLNKLEKGRGLLTKAAIEGASSGGITAIQEGKLDNGTINTGLTVSGFVLAGGILNKIAQKIPETAWSSVLKRTPSESIKNPKLPKQIADEGMTGWSRESISKKSGEVIQKLEMNLDDILSKQKGTIETKKVVEYLDDLKTAYSNIPGEGTAIKAIDNVGKDLMKKPTITVAEANIVKRNIYDHIKRTYGKGLLEIPPTAQAQKQIARGLKTEIENIIPEVKTINQKMAIYLEAKKAIDRTIARGEGKGIAGTGIGMYDVIAGTGIAASGQTIPALAGLVVKRIAGIRISTGASKIVTKFNQLSPTKKVLYYTALKGLLSENAK